MTMEKSDGDVTETLTSEGDALRFKEMIQDALCHIKAKGVHDLTITNMVEHKIEVIKEETNTATLNGTVSRINKRHEECEPD